MPYRRYIPKELATLYPNLSLQEIRAMLNPFWKAKHARMRQADIFEVKIPGLGTLRSHASKKPKGHLKVKKRDIKRKKAQYRQFNRRKENLLW